MGLGGEGVIVIYLFSLEEAGAEWLGGMGMCPSAPLMACVTAGPSCLAPAWVPWGWLPQGTQQVTTAEVPQSA